MNKQKVMIWVLIVGLISCCKPTLTVQRITTMPSSSGSDDEGGLYYALPMTLISVEIPITQTTRKQGDCFWDEALKERLGTKDAAVLIAKWKASRDSTYTFYKLKEDQIAITARPIPDPSKVLHVLLVGKWNKNRELTATLNELGQMTQGEMVNQDRTFDLVVQGVQSVAGIVSTLVVPKSAGQSTGTNLADADNFDLISIDKRKRNLIAVRAARTQLIQSSDNVGAEGILKRKLDELDKLEADLLSHLTFDETKTQVILRADILIQKTGSSPFDSSTPILTFSEEAKPILHFEPDAGTYQNEYLRQFADFNSTPAGGAEKLYTLTVSYTSGKQLADYVSEPPTSSTVARGLAYNVPVWARAKVKVKPKTDPEKIVAVATVAMPQWGKVAYLPEKASSTGFEFDPSTGSLRKLSIKQPGLTADQISKAGTALNSAATLIQPESLTAPLGKATRDNDLIEQKIRAAKLQMQYDSITQVKDKLTPALKN
ncbi:hypothetical protein IC229_33935 [Spirosoma sp. BT702]|uniref:DUF4831 family protein n=1 Tax=Spirosoma profusum TaxID=2771354 RepID=A0A927AWC1_9BACT|nr:hypothetical protein [Spirosoma profusum]MBD2705658.1 hypothetical protein [Spirosoma profusum]